MLVIIREKASTEILKKVSEDLDGYVKVVVDLRRKTFLPAAHCMLTAKNFCWNTGARRLICGAGV